MSAAALLGLESYGLIDKTLIRKSFNSLVQTEDSDEKSVLQKESWIAARQNAHQSGSPM